MFGLDRLARPACRLGASCVWAWAELRNADSSTVAAAPAATAPAVRPRNLRLELCPVPLLSAFIADSPDQALCGQTSQKLEGRLRPGFYRIEIKQIDGWAGYSNSAISIRGASRLPRSQTSVPGRIVSAVTCNNPNNLGSGPHPPNTNRASERERPALPRPWWLR